MSSDYEDPFFSKPRSIEEIADYLGATRTFVYREVVRGKLRGLKFTQKLIRVMPGDLRDWIEQAATQPKLLTVEQVAEHIGAQTTRACSS